MKRETIVRDANQIFATDAESNHALTERVEEGIIDRYQAEAQQVYMALTGSEQACSDLEAFLEDRRAELLNEDNSAMSTGIAYRRLFDKVAKELRIKFTYLAFTTINKEAHTVIFKSSKAMDAGQYFSLGYSVYIVQPCDDLPFAPPLRPLPNSLRPR